MFVIDMRAKCFRESARTQRASAFLLLKHMLELFNRDPIEGFKPVAAFSPFNILPCPMFLSQCLIPTFILFQPSLAPELMEFLMAFVVALKVFRMRFLPTEFTRQILLGVRVRHRFYRPP